MTVSSVTVSPSILSRLRTLWWAIHRWIALVLCVLLVPIAISGALLVWHDELEPLLHPARFAVTGNGTTTIANYLDGARRGSWRAPTSHCLSRSPERTRARCRQLPRIVLRVPASLPREPDRSRI